jgi:GT2 family glycosyltransferase
LDSLKKHLLPIHKVILVNDCGPEVDSLEKSVTRAIKGFTNFEYYRNPKNLGFVGKCNRAVFELDKSGNDILLLNSDTAVTGGFLDEMTEVLYLSDKHGAVSPRSNSATHASIPFETPSGAEVSPQESYRIFKKIHKFLPRYYISVDAPGFCMLTKRTLIKKYGLFDEVYGPGYSEETDYCMRLRKHGYKSLFANHAFVFHYRAETFTTDRKAKLKEKNKKILHDRYPDIPALVKEFRAKVGPIEAKAYRKSGYSSGIGRVLHALKLR